MRRILFLLTVAAIIGVNAMCAFAADAVVEKGKKVSFDYTLTVDNAVVDTSAGKAPLEFTQGDGMIIPGLAKQLEGMKVGEEKSVTVTPEEGYGPVDPKAIQEVPLKNFPAELKLVPGMPLQAKDKEGHVIAMRVKEVKKDTALMDFNHPLAGKTLNFKIKIVSIK